MNVQWTRQRVGELSGMRERMWSVVSRLAPGTVRTKGAFNYLLRLPEGVTEEEAVRVLATKVKVLVTPGRYVICQESPHFHVEPVSPCLRVSRAFYDLWASRMMWASLCVWMVAFYLFGHECCGCCSVQCIRRPRSSARVLWLAAAIGVRVSDRPTRRGARDPCEEGEDIDDNSGTAK